MAAYGIRAKITEVRAMKKTKCFLCKQIKQCKQTKLYDGVQSHDDGMWFVAWACLKCLEGCEEANF